MKVKTIKEMLAVYFIAGTQDTDDLPNSLESALKAGITCFQYREKGEGSLENEPLKMEKMAIRCQELCRQYAVPFIINDNVDLANKIQADGVHVGQEDLSVEAVRQKIEPDKIVGLSTNSIKQYEEALKQSEVDYVGIGPAFLPKSKADHEAILGTDKIKEAIQKNKTLPAVAIGGITEENASEVLKTGVDGVAVVSTIAQSKNMERTISKLKK